MNTRYLVIMWTLLLGFSAISQITFAQDEAETEVKAEPQIEKKVEPVREVKREIEPEEPEDLTIKGQFETLSRKSTSYREKGEHYKVLNYNTLLNLQKNVIDSISRYSEVVKSHDSEITKVENKLKEQVEEIEKLKTNLDKAQRTVDSVNVFGTYVTKGMYNTIMISIIVILISLLIIVLVMFKRGNVTVRSTKNKLIELQESLEQHQKNSLAREQKLARELMDEKLRNKRT